MRQHVCDISFPVFIGLTIKTASIRFCIMSSTQQSFQVIVVTVVLVIDPELCLKSNYV